MVSIVLDLDQTLVLTCERALEHAEYSFNGCCGIVNVRRGFSELIRFLQTLDASIHVFSAGSEVYVQEVCDIIFPPNLLSSISHSKHCVDMVSVFQKILPDDLRCSKTIILDDRVDVYSTYRNVSRVRICPMDDHSDNCLSQAIHILRAEVIRAML